MTCLPVTRNLLPRRSSVSSPTSQTANWPAPEPQLVAARRFLVECAANDATTLLLPDKDADGLCSGLIIYHTLLALGLSPRHFRVHWPAKGSNIHAPAEREAIAAFAARYIIVTDQGSRPGPGIVDDPDVRTLIVDHHAAEGFPERALVCTAVNSPPVAPSSMLAYALCMPLVTAERLPKEPSWSVEEVREKAEYLCALGTMGDLGTGFQWKEPFPSMRECFRKWTKKAMAEAVSLVNAPRRTEQYDVYTAWKALFQTYSPKQLVVDDPRKDLDDHASATQRQIIRLREAREEVRVETGRCARVPPTFSGDGRVALIRIASPAQVHPIIATRWSGSLKGAKLEMVMCANYGYLPGKTNFACRRARSGSNSTKPIAESSSTGQVSSSEGGTDIIALLKAYADTVPGLRESMGTDFARGHKEASGGIVRTEDFERLWGAMAAAKPLEGTTGRKRALSVQKNTLDGWLKKA